MLTFSLSNVTNEDALNEIKKIVRELIHAEDVYKAKFRTEKLHHVRQLVELIEERKDMEKLEAIKKVLDDTPARTASDFEKALNEIKKILEE